MTKKKYNTVIIDVFVSMKNILLLRSMWKSTWNSYSMNISGIKITEIQMKYVSRDIREIFGISP